MSIANIQTDLNVAAAPTTGNNFIKENSGDIAAANKNTNLKSSEKNSFSKLLKESKQSDDKENKASDKSEDADNELNSLLLSLFGAINKGTSEAKIDMLLKQKNYIEINEAGELAQLNNKQTSVLHGGTNSFSQLISKLMEAIKSSNGKDEKLEDIKSALSELLKNIKTARFQADIPVKTTNTALSAFQTNLAQTTSSKDNLLDSIEARLEKLLNGNVDATNGQLKEVADEDKLTKIAAALKNLYSKLSGKENNSVTQANQEVINPVKDSQSLSQKIVTADSENKNNTSFMDKKEDNFLKAIASDGSGDDSSKTNKLNLYMNIFNSEKAATSAPVTSEKVPTINQATMVNDIVKSVKYMESNNLKELTVRINPKELGEIVIKVTMEAGNLKANIDATNRDTYNILNSHFQDLKDSMGNSNIKIQDFNIGLYYGDTTFFKDGSQKQQQQFEQNFRGKVSTENISGDEQDATLEQESSDNNIDKLV